MSESYNYSAVAHYSVLIARKTLTAMNIDVMVCCDVTNCKMVERKCVISWEGRSASIDEQVIAKNFIVPALGVVVLGSWLLWLMFSVLQMDKASCCKISALLIQIN